jgi:phosphate:Na+ symporter
VVGFGLLFLGINFLKTAFEILGAEYTLPVFGELGLLQLLVYVLIGLVLTTLMQSSSAAMVITLSAAQGGLIPLNAAAAVVIGANLGTTTTALLSALGASPTAKRVAASHVAFNVLTALVSLFVMNPLLWFVQKLELELGLMPSPALTLAMFHTVFNVLGVLLIWPVSGALVSFLRRQFTTGEELEAQPRYMNKAILALPFIAADAVAREVSRINEHTIDAFKVSLHFHQEHPQSFQEHRIVRKLADEVGKYAVELSRTELTPGLSGALAKMMESTQQYLLVIDIIEDIALMSSSTRHNLHQEVLAALEEYLVIIHLHLDAQDLGKPDTLKRGTESYDAVELAYRKLKDEILQSAARGELTMEDVDLLLQYVNQAKRACRQILKATQRLLSVRDTLQDGQDKQEPAPVDAAAGDAVAVAEASADANNG